MLAANDDLGRGDIGAMREGIDGAPKKRRATQGEILLGLLIAKAASRSGGDNEKGDARHDRQVAVRAPEGQRALTIGLRTVASNA
jgi:hypothetical protein